MLEDEHYALNFEARIIKIRQICQAWINRTMSIKSKITLINSLMLSVLHYPCSCSFTPTRLLVEVKKLVTDFLWNNARSKIAYILLFQDIQMGGLKLADIETRVLTTHITIIRKPWLNPDSVWASVLALALYSGDGRATLRSKTKLAAKLNKFYPTFKQLLQSWIKVHSFQPGTEEEVRSETPWNNDSVLIKKRPIFWPTWIASGIECINDLLHPTEHRFLSHDEISAE